MTTRSIRLAALLALAWLVTAARPAGADCPDPERPFDFIVGGWVGQQYVLDDDGASTFVGTTVWTAEPILGGCAFSERVFVHGVDAEHVFTARLLRAWDREDERWELTEVDDRGVYVHFEGRRIAGGAWAFEVPRVRDGREYVLRLVWEEVSVDHVRERFERSYDGGASFEVVSTIDFRRSPGLASGVGVDPLPPTAAPARSASPERSTSVQAVDLVRTLPGHRERYLEYNRLNWVPMRRAFVEEGIARSFRVLVAPADSTADWDVALMTEYVDREAYEHREAVFERVRQRPGYEHRLVDGLGPRDLARIVASRELAEVAASD